MSHDCAHLEAVLLGEAPWPGDPWVDAALAGCPDCQALQAALDGVDAAARALPPLPAPPALAASTLAAVLDEMRAEAAPPVAVARPRRRLVLVGGLAAAAALFLLRPTGPAPSAPPTLVERGTGERLPEAALKMAVQTAAGPERLRADRAYAPGDTLRFRAALDRDATVVLVRQDTESVDILATWQLPAGEHDLALGGEPLAWRIEAGETTATFALLAAPADRDPAALPALAPQAAAGGATLCRTARAAGWVCDARTVEVAR